MPVQLAMSKSSYIVLTKNKLGKPRNLMHKCRTKSQNPMHKCETTWSKQSMQTHNKQNPVPTHIKEKE